MVKEITATPSQNEAFIRYRRPNTIPTTKHLGSLALMSKPVETDAATLQLGDELKKAHCLLHSEVLLLLEDVQLRRVEESKSLPLPPPSKIFSDSMAYVKTFSQYSNRELVRAVRHTMMESGLSEFEMAQLGNLTPNTVEEARQLIPSLIGKMEDDDLQKVLDDLITSRRYQL